MTNPGQDTLKLSQPSRCHIVSLACSDVTSVTTNCSIFSELLPPLPAV
jgi:hypothetical protein